MGDSLLAQLVAKDQIRDLVLAYCRACDRADHDLLRSLYVPGAGEEHGINPSGTAEELFQYMARERAEPVWLHHVIGNHYIKLDGDDAEGEVYMIASHTWQRSDGSLDSFSLHGRFLDRYQKHEGDWRFAHRRVVADWVAHPRGEAVADAAEIAGQRVGVYGADDASYDFFKLFRRGER